MLKCKYCPETIGFVETKRGKMMPVNPGVIEIITPNGTVTGFRPHHETCNKKKQSEITQVITRDGELVKGYQKE